MRSLKFNRFIAAAVVLSVPIAAARAQNPAAGAPVSASQPFQPLPPLSGAISSAVQPASALQDNMPLSPSGAQPDNHLLSGSELLGLGSLHVPSAVFDPALRLGESLNSQFQPGSSQYVTYIGGSFALSHPWERDSLSLVYSGNEMLYQPASFSNQSYHDLGISQVFQWGRWIVRLRDDVLYSVNAAFGGLYTGGPGSTGQLPALNSLTPSLLPQEAILTGNAARISNTPVGEVDYFLSPRTTVTFVGSYGFLHFLQSGYIDSASTMGSVGYNYTLTSKTSFALSYDYGVTQFTGTSSRVVSNQMQVSVGRKITGRLALQIGGGPELLDLQNYGPSSGQQLSWSATTALQYNRGLTNYNLTYWHGITNGSGVLYGSTTDTVSAGVTRQFTRFSSVSLNGGDSINRALATAIAGFNAYPGGNFNNRFIGITFSRQVGRHTNVSLNYEYQEQVSSGFCPVASCSAPQPYHVFGVMFDWHPRQIALK